MYKWYYEQKARDGNEASVDLAFTDDMLDVVEKQWTEIVGTGDESREFMKFEERNAIADEEDAQEQY